MCPVHHYVMAYSMQEFPYPWELGKSIGSAALEKPLFETQMHIEASDTLSCEKKQNTTWNCSLGSPEFPKILAHAIHIFPHNPY